MLREGNLSKSKLGVFLQITARNVIFAFAVNIGIGEGGTSGKLGDLSQITARNWKPFLSGNPTRTKISFRSNLIFSEDELFIFDPLLLPIVSNSMVLIINILVIIIVVVFVIIVVIYPTGSKPVGQRGDAEVHLIRRSKETRIQTLSIYF